jgi:hypothetical protein
MKKQAKTSPGMMVMVIGIIAVVGILSFMAFGDQVPAVDPDAPAVPSGECPESTGILTINGVNALNKGTSVTPTTVLAGIGSNAVATNVTSGTTTFPVGSSLKLVVGLPDYIATTIDTVMECGGTILEVPLYQATSDNPAIRIKNDDDTFMGDSAAGALQNQTLPSAGETLSLEVEFKGTSLESSGEGVWIIETPAGSGVNISKIELDGVAGRSVETVHASANAGSKIVAFDIEPIVGSVTVKKTLTIAFTPTGIVTGGVLTDWYAKQAFVDDDGSVGFGIEDSDGTAQHENTFDWDFTIADA